jgi:DnaK suppressor protein
VATAAKKPIAKPAAAAAKKPAAKAAAPAAKKPAAKAAAPVAKKVPAKAAVAAKKSTVAPAKKPIAKPAAAAAKKPVAKAAVPAAKKTAPKAAAPVAKKVPAKAVPAVKRPAATATKKPIAKAVAPAATKPMTKAATSAKPATKPTKKAVAGLLTEAEILKMSDKDYMNDAQQAFFRARLQAMKDEILENARETGEHLKENEVFADPNDRATVEEENMLEQRVRDRERKLLKKIDSALRRLEAGEYGFCLETGEPIGVGRLLARPTAELSIEAQEKHERMEKLFAD